MKSLLTLTALLWLLPMQADAQSRTGQPMRLGVSSPQQPAATAADAVAPRGPILRILERRRMGLTARNVVRVLQAMKADGRLADYTYVEDGQTVIDVSSLAVAVAGQLASERPEAWQDIDWDLVLEWIERIIALLIQYLPIIIDLFTANFVATVQICAAHGSVGVGILVIAA